MHFKRYHKRSSSFLKNYFKKGLSYSNKNYKTNFLYISLIKEGSSFFCLRKFRTCCAVSTKSTTKPRKLGNEVEYSQKASHYIQNSSSLWNGY